MEKTPSEDSVQTNVMESKIIFAKWRNLESPHFSITCFCLRFESSNNDHSFLPQELQI